LLTELEMEVGLINSTACIAQWLLYG